MAMTTFVTYYLAQAPFLLDERQLGNFFLILLLAIVVSPLAGKYSDKVGRIKMLFLALSILLIGMLLTLTQSLWLIIIGLGFVTIGMFSVQSVAPTYLGDLVPSDRATLAVAYQSFFYMGGALGTLVPAWAWAYAGVSGVVWLCVGLVVFGGLGVGIRFIPIGAKRTK
jgi:YNFM family putative membrane transporter